MKAGFGCSGVIQHLEHQNKLMQWPIASPLYNYISSGMFKSSNWKGPSLVSSLLAEALDTFPAHWVINLLPLCLHPTLDKLPCMVKEGQREWERGKERAYPALAPKLSLSLWCWHTWTQTHNALEWITTIRGVSGPCTHICQTPTILPSTTIKRPVTTRQLSI